MARLSQGDIPHYESATSISRSPEDDDDDQSLGILNLDQVTGLSGSILGFDYSPYELQMEHVNRHQIPVDVDRGFDEIPYDKLGPLLMGKLTAEDHDVSVHEVEFGAKELEAFDEEFSDLDESDEGHSMDEADGLQQPEEKHSDASSGRGVDEIDMHFNAQESTDSEASKSRLASLYFRPGVPNDRGDGAEDSDYPVNSQLFDDTNVPRGSNIFGSTQISFGGFLATSHKLSLGFPCDPSNTNRLKVSQETPMSMTEDGDGITDLALHTSLLDIDGLASPQRQLCDEFGDEDFVSGGAMLDKLNADEKEFEKENVFMQDVIMEGIGEFQDSFLCNPFSQSQSHDPAASYMRISIGQFISERTADLGTLDGKTGNRPNFGSKIITPPSNRQPVALIDKTPPDDVTSNARIPIIPEEIRGSGVGSDVDTDYVHGDGDEMAYEGPKHDRTLTPDDLVASPEANARGQDEDYDKKRCSSPEGCAVKKSNILKLVKKTDKPVKISENHSNVGKVTPDLSKLKGETINDTSPIVNLSTIKDFIDSDDGQPEELINYIMKVSKAKSLAKTTSVVQKPQTGKEFHFPCTETSGKAQNCAHSDMKQVFFDTPVRRPADGKSSQADLQSLNVQASGIDESVFPQRQNALGESLKNNPDIVPDNLQQTSTVETIVRKSPGSVMNLIKNFESAPLETTEASKPSARKIGKLSFLQRSQSPPPVKRIVHEIPTGKMQNIRNDSSQSNQPRNMDEQSPAVKSFDEIPRGRLQNIRDSFSRGINSQYESHAPAKTFDEIPRGRLRNIHTGFSEGDQHSSTSSRTSVSTDPDSYTDESGHEEMHVPAPSAAQKRAMPPRFDKKETPGSDASPHSPSATSEPKNTGHRVQFASGTDSDGSVVSEGEVHRKTPRIKPSKGWFSSTPKVPQPRYDNGFERISNIVYSPQVSFNHDYTNISQWNADKSSTLFNEESPIPPMVNIDQTLVNPDETLKAASQPAEEDLEVVQDGAKRGMTPTELNSDVLSHGSGNMQKDPLVNQGAFLEKSQVNSQQKEDNATDISATVQKKQMENCYSYLHQSRNNSSPSLDMDANDGYQLKASSPGSSRGLYESLVETPNVDHHSSGSVNEEFVNQALQMPNQSANISRNQLSPYLEKPFESTPQLELRGVAGNNRKSAVVANRQKSPFDRLPSLPFSQHSSSASSSFVSDTNQASQEQKKNVENILDTPRQSAHDVQTTTPIQAFHCLPNVDRLLIPRECDLDRSLSDCSIEIPGDIQAPGVCCVGLSNKVTIPLNNTSKHWLATEIRVHSLSIDGHDQDIALVVPFVFKDRVVLEPGTVEDLRLVFLPRVAGSYVLQLHITATPLTEDRRKLSPKPWVVKVQSLAESPMIQVTSGSGTGLLDFGALPWGRQKSLPITIINKGRASVPVRLVITNKSKRHCFRFHKSPSANVSIVSNHSCPDNPSLAPVIENTILSGMDGLSKPRPTEIIIHFFAPECHNEKELSSQCPEEFQATFTVELDLPGTISSLASMSLMASVGVARLHTPSDLEEVYMKSCKGQVAIQRIPLRNAGNIPLHVSLEVTHWPDTFTIVPAQLLIEPSDQSEFIITFNPKQSPMMEFKSLILLTVEPDGPEYNIVLKGVLVDKPDVRRPSVDSEKTSVQLLSNRRFLAWGGVAVGKSNSQVLTLKNASDQLMKVMLEIDSSQDFMIISSYGDRKRLATSKEVILKSLEEYPVRVCFKPQNVTIAQAKLQIRKLGSLFKCSIPLTGIGGCSELVVKDSVLNIGHPVANSRFIHTLHVYNSGQRAAYITARCFQDLNCKRKLHNEKILFIQPKDFCLQPDSSQEVLIQLMPTSREESLCLQRSAIVAVINLSHGDELSRQLYIRSIREKSYTAKSQNHTENDLNHSFYNEPKSLDIGVLPTTDMDVDLFYSNMKHLTISLVGSPPVIADSRPQTNTTTAILPSPAGHHTVDHEALTGSSTSSQLSHHMEWKRTQAPSSPPVKDTMIRKVKDWRQQTSWIRQTDTLRTDSTTEPESICVNQWIVEPDRIVLKSSSADDMPLIRKVQITNYTDRNIRFEVLWPGHCISVSPGEGFVSPKSYTLLCVSANRNFRLQDTPLPWSGNILILCEGQTKVLKVQIHEAVDEFGERTASDNKAAQSVQPSTPNPSILEILYITPDKINFPEVKVRHTAEKQFELKNVSSCPVRWAIESFAPPYHKPPDIDAHVYRVTYSVYFLARITGLLEPHQAIQLPVKFMPKKVGLYTQCWEITSEIIDGNDCEIGQKQTYKLELNGKCCQEEAAQKDRRTHSPAFSKTELKNGDIVKCSEGILTLMPNPADFSVLVPGLAEIKKVRLGNKSKEILQVQVDALRAPFRVKPSTLQIKPRHYLSLPIEFNPKTTGFFQEILTIRKPSGDVLTLRLTGLCGS